MSIKRLGKNRYLVRVVVARIAGRQKFHNKTIHGERSEAEAYETEIKNRLSKGLAVAPSSILLDAHIDRYLKSRRVKGNVRPNTLESYRSRLMLISSIIGAVKLSQLTALHIEMMIEHMLEDGYNANSVRCMMTAFHTCLEQALRWRLIHANPMDGVELPAAIAPYARAFDEKEARDFIKACDGSPHGMMFLFALYTGIRPEEYMGLPWGDLDLDRCQVRRTLVWQKGGYYFSRPKTKRGERVIDFRPAFADLLREHKRRQQEKKMKVRKYYRDDLDLVFAGELGEPLRCTVMNTNYFQPLCQSAGITGRVTLYTLRHTYATLLLAAGENPKTVSENMGHATVAFTLDNYAHVIPSMREESARRLEKILNG